MSATSGGGGGGGGSVSEGSEAGESSHSTMSVSDSPSTSFQKHADNVTKISLTEGMVSGGFDVTGSKMNLTTEERQGKDGIVNMGFDYEEAANRGETGTDFKSINGSEKKDKVPEAVNLELVNMVPYSNGNGTNYGVPVNGIPGIPTKKDSEQVDTSTPYDEYFVPVNEHKKYMRGEKLYVTKDKRRPTSWRRCLSWIVACTVISVVLIVAILAGTGVILNQEPNLVQEASVGRNFAGSNLKPAVTQNAPTAEKFTYVPRSIESELVIDNLDFDPALKNANSSAYQDFAEAMESQLKMILFDKETLEHGASDVGLRVVNVSRDPFKVNYRIGWNYKQGVNNPPEPIKMEDVKRRLVESLAKNQGYIDKYHIDREAIKVNHVTDTCQLDNGGCSHICYYNYVTQQFTCTCPTHLILDSTGRNCVEWTGFEDDAVPVPSRPGSYESTSNTPLEQEQGIHYEHDHHSNQHQYEEASPEPEPEPNGQDDHEPQAEPEPSSDDSDGKNGYYMHDHDHMHSVYGSVGEPTAEPEPEPSAEPDSHSDDSHSIYGSRGHEPVAEPTAEPGPEPAAEPSPEPAPEPAAEPSPEPAAEPDSHSDDSHSVYGSKGHEPVAEPTAEPSPEPNAESDTHSDDSHSVYGSKGHEPVAESTTEPSPEPTAESDSHSDDSHSVYGSKGHEPVAEPTAEPSPEPNAESDTHSEDSHSVYGSKGHEPVAEPTAEPSPEPNAESDTHSEDSHSVYGSKGHEPVAEPTAEPSPEPSPEPAAEPNSESASSSSAEHSPESSSETSAQPSPESASSPANDHSPEPAAEPSPDSAVQPNSEHDLKLQPTSESPVKSNDEHKLYIPYQSSEQEHSEPTEVPKSTTESSQSVMSHKQNVSFGHEGESAQGIESVTGPVPDSSSEPAPEPTADDSQDKREEHSPGSTDKPETVHNIHSVHGPQETEPSVETESPIAKPSPDEQTSSIATDHEPASEPTPEPSPEDSGLATGVKSHKTVQPESGSDDHRSVQEHTNHFDAQTTTESNSGVEHHKHLEDILIKALPAGQNASEFNPLENVKVTADGQPIVEEVVLDKSDPTLVRHPETTTHAVKSDGSSQSDSAQVTTEVVNSASTEGPTNQKEGKSDEKTPADENVTILGIVQHEQLAPGVSNLTVVTEESKKLSQPGRERTPQSQEPGHQDTSTTMNPHHESQTIPVNVISFEGNTQAQTFGPPVSDQTEHTPSREVHEGKNDNGDVAGGIHGGYDVTNSHLGVTTLPVDENGLKKSEVNKNEAESNETKSPEELLNSVKDLDNEAFNTLVDKEYKSKSGQPEEKYPNKKVEKKKIKDYVKGDKTLPESTVKPPVTPEDFILQKHVNGNENAFDLDYSLQNEHTTEHDSGVSVSGHEIDGVPGVVLKPQGINNHDISVLQTVAPDFRTETIYPGVTHEWETKPESKTKPDDFKPEKDYKFDKDYKFEKQKGGKKKELKKKGGGKDGKNVELDDGRKYFGDVGKDDEISREVTDVNSFDKFTIQPGMKIASEYNTESEVRSETTVSNDGVSVGVTEESIPRQNHPDSRGPVVYYDGNPPADHTGHLMVEEPNVSTTDVTPGTVYDGIVQFHDPVVKHIIMNTTLGTTVASNDTDDTTFVVYQTTDAPPVIVDGFNSTTAHPTIIVHGQSGNLQDGHSMRFSNSTIYNPSNATVISMFKGNLTHPDGHSFSFTNLTATFPNGSAVHPTIVVHGQSGALQNGHESRFGNSTIRLFENSTVYKIENSSLPGTVFDGHFNPAEGNYHMYTNSSGTFVYRNVSTRPFVIKGQSGDFGNSRVYILENDTKVRPENTIAHRNSTVFTIGNVTGSNINAEIQEVTVQPYEVGSRQGTAYKVNDYFGYISKCAAGQFQCTNGTSRRGSACISLSSKCDSINDCSDGSDELGCIENGCPGNFQCSDGSCLKRNLVCNGIVDCSDGKDEKNCENWKCQFDEFQCPSGRCIPVVWQCDNKPDCDNHTDEFNCQSSCGNDEYFCPEGWCVPLTYKCNGMKECRNGEDEQFCDCSHEEFKCQTGGCVAASQVCNGVEDCPDRSDEWDCIRVETDSNLLKIRTPSGGYESVCADEWSSRHSDEVCSSLGYFSSAPVENENNSSITSETSFYVLKNDSVVDFNQTFLVNLGRTNGTCSSGKLVEINCQEFSCGSRSMVDSSSVDARLVGGMSVTAGQWPSVALLYNTRTLHSCTANVITPRWVLASYNCLKMGNKYLNEQDWKFFGGSTVFEAEKEDAETRRIVRVIPHPQLKFNQFLFSNDLALVELDQPLPFSSNIGAVCLPEQEIQPRQICVTAGWGMNSPEDKSIRQHLQYLPVPTMNLTECNSTEHYSGFITDDKICAGYNGAAKSLCYNEEGAPLMCVNDRGEWELQGVMSYHSNCGRGSHPSIFSSITPVKDWIKKTIGNNFERKLSTVTNR